MILTSVELLSTLNHIQYLKEQNKYTQQEHEKYSKYENTNSLEIKFDIKLTLFSLQEYEKNRIESGLFKQLKHLTLDVIPQELETIQDLRSKDFIIYLIGEDNTLDTLSLKISTQGKQGLSIIKKSLIQEMIKETSTSTKINIHIRTDVNQSVYYSSSPQLDKYSKQKRMIKYKSVDYQNIAKYNIENLDSFQDITSLEYEAENKFDTNFQKFIAQQLTLQKFVFKSLRLHGEKYRNHIDFVNLIFKLPNLKKVQFKIGQILDDSFIKAFNESQKEILEESKVTNLKLVVSGYSSFSVYSNFAFLCKLKHLQSLNLDNVNSYPLNIGSALQNLNQLTVLKLRIKIDKDNLKEIALSLKKCTQLKTFMISIQSEHYYDNSMIILYQEIQFLVNLDRLNIQVNSHNLCNSTDLVQFAQSLKSLKKLTKLNLAFYKRYYRETEYIQLSLAIKELTNLKKLSLDLKQQDDLGDEYLFSVAESILQLQKLEWFNLTLNSSKISRKGTLCLQNAIQSLKGINLSYANLELSDYETNILQFLKLTDNSLQPIKRTKYSFSHLSLDKLSVPSNYKYNPPYYNDLFRADKYKYEELPQLHTVSGIYMIMQNELNETGIYGLFNGLNALPNLSELYLEFQRISYQGMEEVASSLENKYLQLKELTLHFKLFQGEFSIAAINNALKKMNQLEYLSLFVLKQHQGIIRRNNFFEGLKSLKSLQLIFNKQTCTLFNEISSLQSSFNCISLIFNKTLSLNEFQELRNQLIVLQKFKYLRIFIKFRFGFSGVLSEETAVSLAVQKLENLTNLVYFHKDRIIQEKVKQRFYKNKRLVEFKKISE